MALDQPAKERTGVGARLEPVLDTGAAGIKASFTGTGHAPSHTAPHSGGPRAWASVCCQHLEIPDFL